MELRHLRYFVALCECMNFTKAAEKVHVTQSTLSHQIRQLEDEIGQPLFERIGKRIVLTRAGDVFLGYAWKALREVDQGLSELKRAAGALSGSIRIGATQTFLAGAIPRCLLEFRQANPSVKVTLEELTAAAIGQQLLDETLDLGIGYEPDDMRALWFEPLYAEEMMLLVSRQHPFAQRKKVRMVELHQQDMILLPETYATRKMLDDCFKAAGATPHVSIEMNSFSAIFELVAAGLLASIVSCDVRLTRDDICRVHLENPTPIRTPGLLWKRKHRQDAATRSIAAILREQALHRKA